MAGAGAFIAPRRNPAATPADFCGPMPAITPPASRPYSISFRLVCLSSFLFFASFNPLLPELTDHFTRLGGG